jgi:adenylylsulfate kinase-like enzyme
MRRVAEVARLMSQAGLVVLVALISPYRKERAQARAIVSPENFLEVFVDTPLTICESRDPKGLYQLARKGKLPQMSGIGDPYEPPENADVVWRHDEHQAGDCSALLALVLQRLQG